MIFIVLLIDFEILDSIFDNFKISTTGSVLTAVNRVSFSFSFHKNKLTTSLQMRLMEFHLQLFDDLGENVSPVVTESSVLL